MSDIAVRVENLGKLYRIGQIVGYSTLRESLMNLAYAPMRRLRKTGDGRQKTEQKTEDGRQKTEESGLRSPVSSQSPVSGPPSSVPSHGNFLWALKDVSFEVKSGEAVGIIGRNGSGKSTLLKILSRITAPTEGRVEICGRVGSLLEVGTGFHPELTGRENIHLNGAVIGMKKAEVKRKFDEIVAFSEIEKFLETPVKRYSSGMYVRLAFAVAAHLEPEILIVDEVLAVGDSAFQKKCLGKMGSIASQGRTVLFVSHQMNSIRRLCERCIWLDAGHVRMVDHTVKVVTAYEAASSSGPFQLTTRTQDNNVPARFLRWEITEPKTEQPNLLTTLGTVTFKMRLQVNRAVRDGQHGIQLMDGDRKLVWGTAVDRLELDPGIHEFSYTLATLPLRPGPYYWQVSLWDKGTLLDLWDCLPELMIGTKPLTHPRDEGAGVLNVPCEFHVEHLQ